MKLNKHRIDKTIRTKLPEHKVEYDDEGRAIIDMTFKDDSNFLSAYSTSDRLPSDSASRRTPLPSANSSFCQVCSGLSPPSCNTCRAH